MQIKPDSKARLDEMAKLMQTQTQQKYFIVGQSDNLGNFDRNMEEAGRARNRRGEMVAQ